MSNEPVKIDSGMFVTFYEPRREATDDRPARRESLQLYFVNSVRALKGGKVKARMSTAYPDASGALRMTSVVEATFQDGLLTHGWRPFNPVLSDDVRMNVRSLSKALRDMATLLRYDPVQGQENLRMLADRVEQMQRQQQGAEEGVG